MKLIRKNGILLEKRKLLGGGILEKKTSIRWKLLAIVLFPILFLGLGIFFFGITLIYGFATNSIRDEVETTTYLLKGCFDLSVRGDYVYEDGIFKKGLNVRLTLIPARRAGFFLMRQKQVSLGLCDVNL